MSRSRLSSPGRAAIGLARTIAGRCCARVGRPGSSGCSSSFFMVFRQNILVVVIILPTRTIFENRAVLFATVDICSVVSTWLSSPERRSTTDKSGTSMNGSGRGWPRGAKRYRDSFRGDYSICLRIRISSSSRDGGAYCPSGGRSRPVQCCGGPAPRCPPHGRLSTSARSMIAGVFRCIRRALSVT